MKIVVFGGGRWARVVVKELLSLLPLEAHVIVVTASNAVGMLHWVTSFGLESRVSVFPTLTEIENNVIDAVIVVNAALNHEKAAEWAIRRGIPVLVEKPFTTSYTSSQRIVNLAKTSGTYIAAGHVFLFARYVDEFCRHIAEIGDIHRLRIVWTDPLGEIRHGDQKVFDVNLPVYLDCLPHVFSILYKILDGSISSLSEIQVKKNKEQAFINCSLNNKNCLIELERNGALRHRFIEVVGFHERMSLDFSMEPGVIAARAESFIADPKWDLERRPLASMLAAFLRGAVGGTRDSRLDVHIALMIAMLMDKVASVAE